MKRAKFFSRVLAGLALLAAPAGASAADQALPLKLKGVNVIEGDTSGYLPVHLPVDALVDPGFYPNKSVTVEGEGKFHGVVFRQVGSKPQSEPLLAAGRFNPDIFCTGCGTRVDQGISIIGAGDVLPPAMGGSWTLPKGDYRLYLVTDGPGRVTLRLPQLEGEQRLTPAVRTSATAKVLPLRTPLDVQNHRTYGDSGQLGTEGIVLETHLFYYGMHAHSELWTCWYTGEPTHPLSFYPGCPADEGQETAPMWFQNGIVDAGAGATAGVGILRATKPGTYSAGGTMTSVAATTSSGWAATWIDFESLDGSIATPRDPDPAAPDAGAPGETGKQPGSPSAAARTRVMARRVDVRGRRASVRLRCEGSAACSGALQIANGRLRAYKVPAGKSARLRVAISKALALKAKRKRGFATTLSIAEGSAVQTVRVTLRRARR